MTDLDKKNDGRTYSADGQTETIPLSEVNCKPLNPVIATLVLAAAPFVPASGITSASCSQKFLTLGISDKGQVCLSGSGHDFIFNAKYIKKIIPCVESHPPRQHYIFSAIEAVGAVASYWAKKPWPEKPKPTQYTAIKIGGKYQCTVFVEVEYEAALKKLAKAIHTAQLFHEREFK